MYNLKQFYIGGQWVAPAKEGSIIDIVNPATEAVIGKLAMGSAEDVERAVDAARAAFPAWSTTTREERAAVLGRIIELYRARIDEISTAIREEIGAPLSLSKARQAPMGLQLLESAVEALRKMEFVTTIG
ncbi:aldehyde dehydrogenase family protein, partial [Cupriavidus sp. NPDC089707]|uniref:aldehyde dehydrogenase family protein n=1 Tax=Cupriavidus sp. NPDC089707 TaxID=3363963 RepID=UPI00381D382F